MLCYPQDVILGRQGTECRAFDCNLSRPLPLLCCSDVEAGDPWLGAHCTFDHLVCIASVPLHSPFIMNSEADF